MTLPTLSIQEQTILQTLKGRIKPLKKVSFIDDHDRWGNTILMHAVMAGETGIVNYLIAHGADINCQNARGWTPLFLAIHHCHYDIVQILLEQPTLDQDHADEFDHTAVIIAASAKHNPQSDVQLQILDILLDHGFNHTSQCDIGKSPLWYAVFHQNLSLVERLLEKTEQISSYSQNALLQLSEGLADESEPEALHIASQINSMIKAKPLTRFKISTHSVFKPIDTLHLKKQQVSPISINHSLSPTGSSPSPK